MNVNLEEFYRGKRVLITGGLGFVGSNLAHYLVGLGAVVEIVDNYLPVHGANRANLRGIEDKVVVRELDIRAGDELKGVLAGKDIVFHLAAQCNHGASLRDPVTDMEINVLGTLSLLESLRRFNPDAVLVGVGTRAEYGSPPRLPVTEDEPLKPLDIYGSDKLTAGLLARMYHRLFGLHTAWIRLSNVYGPRAQMSHSGYGVLNWFIRRAIDGEVITVYGDGSQRRDYTYVADIAEALSLVGAEPRAYGQVLNLGNDQALPLVEIVRKIIEVAGGGRMEFVPWPEESRKIDVGDFSTDYTRLNRLVGWRPLVGLDEGLELTVEYYRAHKEFYW